MKVRWMVTEEGTEVDLEAFATLAQLRSALRKRTTEAIWLTDPATGREHDAETLFDTTTPVEHQPGMGCDLGQTHPGVCEVGPLPAHDPACTWEGHPDALQEHGWCPECQH